MKTMKCSGFKLIGIFETDKGQEYEKDITWQVSDMVAETVEEELDEIVVEIQMKENLYGAENENR